MRLLRCSIARRQGKNHPERIPMLWADTIHLTPIGDHYRGGDREIFPGDSGKPVTILIAWRFL